MSGGKSLASELEERDRLGDVLEPVLAEVGEGGSIDEGGGRLREDDLAAVARGGDPRCEVDVVSDVALVGQKRGPGVQADPHLDRAGGERPR